MHSELSEQDENLSHFQDAVSEGVSMRQKSSSKGNVPHSSVLSVAVITPWPKAMRRKGLLCSDCSLSLRKVGVRTQAGAEARRNHRGYRLALSMAPSACLSTQLWTTCSRLKTPTMGWTISATIGNQDNAPQPCLLQANLTKVFSHGFFFPGDLHLCQTDKNKPQEYIPRKSKAKYKIFKQKPKDSSAKNFLSKAKGIIPDWSLGSYTNMKNVRNGKNVCIAKTSSNFQVSLKGSCLR